MHFDDLLLSENSNAFFNKWSKYRSSITDYIYEAYEDYKRLSYLQAQKKLRIDDGYNNHKDSYNKPVLAIWGAGNCNDIDIKKLSSYFTLVLIDSEKNKLDDANERFLPSEDIIKLDIPFWHIERDCYHMYEAMLSDSSEIDDIIEYLEETVSRRQYDISDISSKFDYSVCIGLSSQLCSRLIAVLSYYTDNYSQAELAKLLSYISGLNKIAVTNMYNAITVMTKGPVMIGYEIKTYLKKEYSKCDNNTHTINEVPTSILSDFITNEYPSDIDGNLQLQNMLFDDNALHRFIGHKSLTWSFSYDKIFLMHIVTFTLSQ